MDSTIFIVVFIGFSLLGIILYALYLSFGPPSKFLKDPFEEDEE